MISEKAFQDSAKQIGCAVSVIKAVAEVESGSSGFLENGDLKILFEPYVFGRLTGGKYKDKTVTITQTKKDAHGKEYPFTFTYPLSLTGNWDIHACHYGDPGIQWQKVQAAILLDKNAAQESCSYGKFQVMGFNHDLAGYPSAEAMLNDFKISEDRHLQAFTYFIIKSGMAPDLISHNFKRFAIRYNGLGYDKHTPTRLDDYDYLLEQAEKKYLIPEKPSDGDAAIKPVELVR
jgi:hypothetical protein